MLAIEQLRDQIADEKAEQSVALQTAFNRIELLGRIPDDLISVQQFEDGLSEKQNQIQASPNRI